MTTDLQLAGADSPAGIARKRPAADVAYQTAPTDASRTAIPAAADPGRFAEFGGPAGPEPTRFGDWEKNGRCIDF